jgi:hypothetical protein
LNHKNPRWPTKIAANSNIVPSAAIPIKKPREPKKLVSDVSESSFEGLELSKTKKKKVRK